MTSPSSSGPTRLTGQDLSRLKKYLADNLISALDAEGIPIAERADFAKKNILHVYEQTQLKLP